MPYNIVDPKALLLSFPVVQNTAKTFPIPETAYTNSHELRSWAEKAKIGTSGTHVINLVASVIEDSEFSGDAKFDLFAAYAQWDPKHQNAFDNWLKQAFT